MSPTFSIHVTRVCESSHDRRLSSDVSRQSEISIQCYLRKEEPKRGSDGLADDMGNDIFLGGIRFTPDFDDMPSQDQWYDITGGTGKIQMGMAFKPISVRVIRLCPHTSVHLKFCFR